MKKKLLTLALTLALCLGLAVPALAFPSIPEPVPADAPEFVIEDGVLTQYNGPGGDVVIPDGVTWVGSPLGFTGPFAGRADIASVTIPEGVAGIGQMAFSNCTNLSSITIPESVTQIGVNAFSNTPWLASLGDFPVVNGILLAYQGDDTSAVIPEGVTEINAGAFSSAFQLTSVTIPDSVTAIGLDAFVGCENLISVAIPDSVTEIAYDAFQNTPFLASLGDYPVINGILFPYQGGDSSIVIPDGVTRISQESFYQNTDMTPITSVTIPDSVTEIGDRAFAECSVLTSVTIPASVTSIGIDAFHCWNQETGRGYDPTPGLTLHGVAGSYAETYARENGFPFTPEIAHTSTQSILVNGTPVEFHAYALLDENGNPTNYVKLRDVANVLNGTAAQFEVSWNGVVNILPHTPYTPNGSEMSTPFSGNRIYTLPASPTSISGTAAELDAIVLTDDEGGQYTYYKLRDLGAALGFTVDWSAEKGAFIETE